MKFCHGKSAFATSQNDIVSEFFEIGETLFFTKYGWSRLVKAKSFFLDEANILRIIVTNTNGDNIVTNKENIHSPSNPDIRWITESAPEYGQAANIFLEEAIEKITLPTHLSPLQQEFLSVHFKLNHLPFTIMLGLEKMSIFLRRFLKLRNDFTPCISCLFGQAHLRPWRQKSSAN